MGEISRRRFKVRRYFVPMIICLCHWIAHSRCNPIENSKNATKSLAGGNELSWQAWFSFALENANSDSPSNRKITPKSVFIAPELQDCAEGYKADTMGRCVKSVPMNRDAQIDFLLQRLNAVYSRKPETNDSDDKILPTPVRPIESNGPMQFRIPIKAPVKLSGVENSPTDEDDVDEEEGEESIESMISPIVVEPGEENDTKNQTKPIPIVSNDPKITNNYTLDVDDEETDEEYVNEDNLTATTTTVPSTLLEDNTEISVTETSGHEDDEYVDDSEILKHGEAGMTIPRDNIDILYGNRMKEQSADDGSGESMYEDFTSTTIVVPNKETSNDMTIDDSESSTRIDEEGSGESNDTITTANSLDTTTTTKDQLITDSTSSETLFDEVQSKDDPDDDEDDEFKIFGKKFKSVPDDLIKFPAESKQEDNVRFPSEDFNSIQTQKVKKERFHYRARDETNGSHRKQFYWWPTPTRDAQRLTTTTPSPIVLTFWTRMPFIKDPSLYPKSTRDEDYAQRRKHRNSSASLRSRGHLKNQRTILGRE